LNDVWNAVFILITDDSPWLAYIELVGGSKQVSLRLGKKLLE